MLALALFSWWYTTAWRGVAARLTERLDRTLGFFSVGLLFRTLFDPFRQIAAGQVRGGLDAKFRAFADRTFSRFVGAFMRTLFILIGLASALGIFIFGIIQMIVWPLIPLLPLIAIVGMLQGWTL